MIQGSLGTTKFAGSLLDSGFAALGKAAENLDGVVNDAANPIGRGKIALPLDVTGNDFKVVEG